MKKTNIINFSTSLPKETKSYIEVSEELPQEPVENPQNAGMWTNFGLSILASIIASIIMIVAASFFSAKFRWLIITILNALVNGDIQNIFPNAQLAQDTLKAEMAKSKRVRIFAARGSELSRSTFLPLFKRTDDCPLELLHLLLPLTEIPKGEYDWIAQREKEMNDFDDGAGNNLRSQINTNVRGILERKKDEKIKIRRHNVPTIGRIIITDFYVYFTPYQRDKYGMNSTIYQFRIGGSFYESLLRFFVQVWEAYEPRKDEILEPSQDDRTA